MAEKIRLDRLLSNSGYGTRSEVKRLIKNGIIRIDGNTVYDGAVRLDPEKSIVAVSGEILRYRKYIYIMMNKPSGVITATNDSRHKTVSDILPEEYACFGLFPVGRLDMDTEGLLIMTNDGPLAHELTSPRRHAPKRYYALIEGEVTDEDAAVFKKGATLDDGYVTMPAELKVICAGSRSEVEIVIYEGRFHQVKRMFEAVGKKVLYLKRTAMGGLELDGRLEPGKCRELTDSEVDILHIQWNRPTGCVMF